MDKDKVIVAKTSPEHIGMLKNNLSEENERESFAMAHKSGSQVLQEAFDASEISYTMLYNGEPVLSLGVIRKSLLSDEGLLWLMHSADIKKVKIRALRKSVYYLKKFLMTFNSLENYIDARNVLTIKWLKWCNFTIDDAKRVGSENMPFHKFHLRRGVL